MSTLLLSLLLMTSLARAGGENGGGGGDPLATEFLLMAKDIVAVRKEGAFPELKADLPRIEETILGIENSLEGHHPKLQFVLGEAVSCFGAQKFGCVSKSGNIQVARAAWINATPYAKAELVVMETLIASRVKGRYRLAPVIASAVVSRGGYEKDVHKAFLTARTQFATAAVASIDDLRLSEWWSCEKFKNDNSKQIFRAFRFLADTKQRIFYYGEEFGGPGPAKVPDDPSGLTEGILTVAGKFMREFRDQTGSLLKLASVSTLFNESFSVRKTSTGIILERYSLIGDQRHPAAISDKSNDAEAYYVCRAVRDRTR